jgi:hypothetical protein
MVPTIIATAFVACIGNQTTLTDSIAQLEASASMPLNTSPVHVRPAELINLKSGAKVVLDIDRTRQSRSTAVNALTSHCDSGPALIPIRPKVMPSDVRRAMISAGSVGIFLLQDHLASIVDHAHRRRLY